jgi:hypothetical protein
MEYDLRTRVVSLEHQSTLHSQRIGELEKWQRLSDIADARKDEQFKNMDARFSSIDKKIDDLGKSMGAKTDEIGGTLKCVNRTILTGVILGVIAFLIKGGFNLP